MTQTPARILVVDDEVGMREGCRRALTSHGFVVTTAEHGADGLQRLREQAFDLVLLDAMMPGMSGLELLEHVHKRDPDTVCVMITGYATVDLATQAMKQGADGFLPKPFTSDELLSAVRQGLQERQRRLVRRQQAERDEEHRQLERTRDEMAKLHAIESRFMLVIAQELRNPAGVIKNYVQLMRSGYVDAEEWDEYLDKLDMRASQLLQMLDDLLELAHLKGTPGPAKLEPVDVASVLREVVRQSTPAARAKGLDVVLELKASPAVLAHRSHLCSLYTQLVDNAIAYTPAGAAADEVRITLDVDEGMVETSVSDPGIGISTEDLTRIFQDFYRSESAREEIPFSTGLGLSIAMQVVQMYQGRIDVESEAGAGTVITTRFPLAEPASSGGS